MGKHHRQQTSFVCHKKGVKNTTNRHLHALYSSSHNNMGHYDQQISKRSIRIPIRKTGCRVSTSPIVKKLLFQPLPTYETGRNIQTNCKPKEIEHWYCNGKISNGGCKCPEKCNQEAPVGCILGPQRCIPTCNGTQELQKVPTICNKWSYLPIQNNAIWTQCCAKNIYHSSRNNSEMGRRERYTDDNVLRRLAYIAPQCRYTVNTCCTSNTENSRLGVDHKHQEVRSSAKERVRVHRPRDKYNTIYCTPHRKEANRSTNSNFTVSECTGNSSRYYENARYPNIPGRDCPIREIKQKEISTKHQSHKNTQVKEISKNHSNADNEVGFTMVERQFPCQDRSGNQNTPSTNHNNDRCITPRLGRSVRAQFNKGNMETQYSEVAYKCIRDASSNRNSKTFPCQIERKTRITDDRQYNSTGVHKTRGRYSVEKIVRHDRKVVTIGTQTPNSNNTITHINRSECSSRSAEPEGQTSFNRMEAEQTHIQKNLQNRQTGSRYVCNQMESPITTVHKPMSRHNGIGNKRTCLGLEKIRGNIRISTKTHSSKGHRKERNVQRKSVANSTSKQTVPTTPTNDRTLEIQSEKNTKRVKVVNTRARTGNTAPKSRGPAASRVELIKRSLESQGISTKIAEAAAKPQRESSIKRYEHIWKKYADWYHKKWSEDPCTTSVIRLAEYLLKLKDSKLSYATIATHKSAICRTLTSLGKCNPGNNYVIRDLLKNFQKTIKRNDYSIPDWNFTVVLMALTKAPFEPLSDIDVKYLTMKTLFLTTWASAARCSEIQALTIADGHYMRDHENRYIDLVPNTSFIAKNQLTTEVPRRYRIQLLKDFVGPAETEALLCPVRALRIYVKRTKEIRDNTQQLFINPNKNNGMAKHSISYWLKRCIELAYEISEPQLLKTLHRVTPHEIRAMATTLAVNKHVPIQSIMKKAYWKTDTSFTSFYFKDIAKYVKNDVGLQTTAAGYCLQL